MRTKCHLRRFASDARFRATSRSERRPRNDARYSWRRTGWAITLLSLLLLLALPAPAQAQFEYTTNDDTITITGYTGPGGAVAIPDRINGLPVTSIGYAAFYSFISLTSVTIPNSATSIGDIAFASCTSLTSVTIPNSVTSIGYGAFANCGSLTSVSIPNSVTSIGHASFLSCTSLSAITVDDLNSFYTSVDGVLVDKSQTLLLQCPGGKAGSYTIPNSVTSIGNNAFTGCASLIGVTIPNSVTNIGGGAFAFCTSMTSVTIPNSVTSIGEATFNRCASLISVTIPNSVTSIEYRAFSFCTSLTGVCFQGDVPEVVGLDVFEDVNNATVYYLPGTTGWGTTFAGLPTVLWNPLVDTSDASFGVRTNRFGFTITGASNLVIVVEACTNLANPAWIPVGTNTLTDGASYFSDPQWTNYPARFYRLRSP